MVLFANHLDPSMKIKNIALLMSLALSVSADPLSLSSKEHVSVAEYIESSKHIINYANLCLYEIKNYSQPGADCVTYERKYSIFKSQKKRIDSIKVIYLKSPLLSEKVDAANSLYNYMIILDRQTLDYPK